MLVLLLSTHNPHVAAFPPEECAQLGMSYADRVALPCQIASRTMSHELRTAIHEVQRPPLAQKEKSRGCLPSRKHPDEAVAGSGVSFRGKSGPSFKGNPLEIEQENETVKEVRLPHRRSLTSSSAPPGTKRTALISARPSPHLPDLICQPRIAARPPWAHCVRSESYPGCCCTATRRQHASKAPCGKTLDGGRTAPAGVQVEAIAWRVKKSLLLHWLTCGIYSTRQSGGTQGFWKGVRENFASLVGYPEPEPSRNLGAPTPAFTTLLAPFGRLWFQSLQQKRGQHTGTCSALVTFAP